MDVAVEADLVAGGSDLRGDRRPALDLLADEEERRRRACGDSASRTAGVPCGCGPSSKVSATPCGRPRRQGMPSRSATRGASGSGAGQDHAAAAPAQPAATAPATFSRAVLRTVASGEHEGGGRREVREARIRPPRALERALERAPELAARRHDLGEPEAAQRRVVATDVPASPPERDGRAAAHERLEHGQPAGRVNEHVLAAIQSGMRSVKPSTRTRGSLAKRPDDALPQRLVVPAQADDPRHALHRQGLLDRTDHVADAPASAGDEHDPPARGRPSSPRALSAGIGTRNSGREKP